MKKNGLKIAVRIPLVFLGLAFFASVFIYVVSAGISEKEMAGEIFRYNSDAQARLGVLIDRDIHTLEASLDILLDNKDIKETYLLNDREKLFEYTKDLFARLRDEHGITHWYFTLADGINFLRVHEKDIHGDKIERPTFKKAEEEKMMSNGLELGKTAFALRAVAPYYDKGRLIGYMELGQEIDGLIGALQRERGDYFIVFGEKSMIQKADWESAIKQGKIVGDWDMLERHVLLSQPPKGYISTGCFNDGYLKGVSGYPETQPELRRVDLGGRDFVCSGFSLIDVEGKKVGAVVALYNVSNFTDIFSGARSGEVFLWIILMAVTILFAAIYVFRTVIYPLRDAQKMADEINAGNLEKGIKIFSDDEIGVFAGSFNVLAQKLREFKETFDKKLFEKVFDVYDRLRDLGEKNTQLEQIKKAVLNILQDTKELEDSLRKERDRSSAIISSMGEGLLVIGKNFEVLVVNKTALDLLQLSEKDVMGQDSRSVIQMYKGKDVVLYEDRPVSKVLQDGGTVLVKLEDDYYYQTAGRKFPVALVTAPLKGESGELAGAIVVFHDITDEKSLDSAKNDFISIASHQLRTPITAVRWYSEMLQSQTYGPLNKDQGDFVSRILDGAMRLNNIIRLFLAMARMESGTEQLQIQKFSLPDLAGEVIKDIEPIAVQNGVKIALEPEMGSDVNIYFDPSMVKQVLSNLVSNSVWYSDPASQECLVQVKLLRTAEDTIVSVKDNGIGIESQDRDKIFNKFFRAQNARSRRPEGSGLGLSFVRSMVEAWKGKIWFESPAVWQKEGKKEKGGTIFYFTIPLVKPPEGKQM